MLTSVTAAEYCFRKMLAIVAGALVIVTLFNHAVSADDDDAGPATLLAHTSLEPSIVESKGVKTGNLSEGVTSDSSSAVKPYFQSEPLEDAILIVNGRYIPTPLTVTSNGEDVLVNGQALPLAPNALDHWLDAGEPFEFEDGSMRRNRRRRSGRGFSRRGRSDSSWRSEEDMFAPPLRDRSVTQPDPCSAARTVAEVLSVRNSLCLVMSDKPLICIRLSAYGVELLQALQSNGAKTEPTGFALSRVPGWSRSTVAEWIQRFDTSPAFDQLVTQKIEFFRDVELRNRSQSEAVARLQQLAYPMSIAGLLLSVMACGHLISNKPPSRSASQGDVLSSESLKIVTRSLWLVGALSLLDLAWTILASQANQMTELNPFASGLIKDPVLLALFKFAMTGTAVGLLLVLRRHRVAQTASWWACLILTLLTMRWLTFNSMFA
ncbi:MAG: DUF5658 family protein [Planctomycetota bacterium]|jgi:hypothetical protein